MIRIHNHWPDIAIFGKGFLGNSLFKSLKDRTWLVGIYSKADVDYTSQLDLSYWLREQKVRLIINASGYTGIPNIDAAENDREACWKYNVEVPTTMAIAARDCGVQMLHISSGCIYNGYEKEFTEDDDPNFGIFNAESSFYSKSKHAAERILSQFGTPCFRIRMPVCADTTKRNYITKLLGYDNLINMRNSITCVDDFCELINTWLYFWINGAARPEGLINAVNPGAITASDVIELLLEYGVENTNHKFIKLKDLDTVAARSNCVLDTGKLNDYNMSMPPARESLRRCIRKFSEEWKLKKEH